MIEKLERYIREEDGIKISCPPDNVHIIRKINEIVELLNAIVVDVDGTKCIDGSKTRAENVQDPTKCLGKRATCGTTYNNAE